MGVYSELGTKLKTFITGKDKILDDKVEAIDKHERYVNTDLDYGYFTMSNNQSNVTDIVLFDTKQSGNLEINNGLISIKTGKTYKISFRLYGRVSKDRADYSLYNNTESEYIFPSRMAALSVNYNTTEANTQDGFEYIYCPKNDCEICIKSFIKGNQDGYFSELFSENSYIVIEEINRQIVIDPVEHVNDSHGIEDTPVGHIIAHMGTVAPKHYLICDGTEYNIADYPYLAQHIEDNFGVINYFGGDGETTFAVPNLTFDESFLSPQMTSDTVPSPYIATASDCYDGTYAAFKAFNGNIGDNDCWHSFHTVTADNPSWVQINFNEIKNFKGILIYPRTYSTNFHEPKTFQVLGSHGDEEKWDILGEYTDITEWTQGKGNYFEFTKIGFYSIYRIVVFESTTGTVTAIGDVQFLPINNNLECIKYEPTYFMNTYNTNYMHNTNYMQPSLYSEEERVVGCWINGKPLYEKTIKSLTKTVDLDKTIETMCSLVSMVNSTIANNPYDLVNGYDYGGYSYNVNYMPNRIWHELSGCTANYYIDVIQYTKTTDAENSFTTDMIKDYVVSDDAQISSMQEEINTLKTEIAELKALMTTE